jgi:hypothetical protein
MIRADVWPKIENFRVQQSDNVYLFELAEFYEYNRKRNKKKSRVKS